MSTEQEIGVSVWLPRARSVIREEPGSLRYFSLSGLCTDRRSMLLPGMACPKPIVACPAGILVLWHLELRDDRRVIALRILHVGGEGDGFVVQELVVDFGASVVSQQTPAHQDVVYHLAFAEAQQRVPGRLGDGVLAGHHHPSRQI